MIGFFVRELKKQKNKGSAIVSVIVIVSFISIMGTILLYVSGINYQMKVSDYMTKESFYGAEEVVELLRSQIIIDVNAASENAFNEVISDYSYYSDLSVQLTSFAAGTSEYTNLRKELSLYQKRFTDSFESEFIKLWKERFTASVTKSSDADQYYTEVVAKLFPGAVYDKDKCTSSEIYFEYNGYDVYVPESWFDFTNYSKDADKIASVSIMAVSGNDYTSMITTSFAVVPPTIDYKFKETGKFFKGEMVDNVFYVEWNKS